MCFFTTVSLWALFHLFYTISTELFKTMLPKCTFYQEITRLVEKINYPSVKHLDNVFHHKATATRFQSLLELRIIQYFFDSFRSKTSLFKAWYVFLHARTKHTLLEN